MSQVMKSQTKREPLANTFLREMKSRNFPVQRVANNMYFVDTAPLKAQFYFLPFGRVGVSPLIRAVIYKKMMFWKAEVVVDDFGQLIKKCVDLRVIHPRDYDRYFK